MQPAAVAAGQAGDAAISTELLRSIDASLKTIVNIMFWWLFLSIAAVVIYVAARYS